MLRAHLPTHFTLRTLFLGVTLIALGLGFGSSALPGEVAFD
jgi:hypothetical protein